MKISRTELARKLKQMKSITPPKTDGVFQGILLKDGVLTANNFEIAITTRLEAAEDESFIIPLKAVDLIENLPDGDLSITEKNNKITVKSAKGRSTFQTVPADEFNGIEQYQKGDAEETVSIDGQLFAESVNKVMYACDEKSPREAKKGVYFEGDGEFLNIVACDGVSLAWAKIPYTEKFKVLVPKTTLQKVLSVIGDEITLNRFGKSNAVFITGEYTVYTKLLTGEFIDYKSIVPKAFEGEFSVNRNDLQETIGRCLVCMDDSRAPARFIVSEDDGVLRIEAISNISEFSEEISVSDVNGKSITAGLSPRILSGALKSVGTESVKFKYISPVNPFLIETDNLLQIVMPMRLKS